MNPGITRGKPAAELPGLGRAPPSIRKTNTMPTPYVAPATDTADTSVEAELKRLRAENEKLKEAAHKAANRPLTYKVSEKGALSIYGGGKWPTTFYINFFDKLIADLPRLQAFVEENRSKFSTKPVKE
jgi:hypothetical protein